MTDGAESAAALDGREHPALEFSQHIRFQEKAENMVSTDTGDDLIGINCVTWCLIEAL